MEPYWFVIGADGQTLFQASTWQRLRRRNGMLWFQTQMEPRWASDGVFLGELGTTKGIEMTRSFRRMRQINNGIQRLCGCLSGYRGTRGASFLTHLEQFANVTSRDLWCKSMARQTVAQPAKEIHKSLCQGVENGLRISSIERNKKVSHVQLCNKRRWDQWPRRPYQFISLRKWNKNHNNNVR